MTHFDHLLHKIDDSCNAFIQGLQQQFEVCTNNIEQFEKLLKEKYGENTSLQSICEDEDEGTSRLSSESTSTNQSQEEENILSDKENELNEVSGSPTRSKKQSKADMQEAPSPEGGKRPKRHAAAKALLSINKQVNVNLTQKLRRPEPEEDKNVKKGRKTKESQEKSSQEAFLLKDEGTSRLSSESTSTNQSQEEENILSDKENELNEVSGSPTRSKKQSKADMQEAPSPEGGKRPKRHAAAKALLSINKQVNVNLTQKLRRPEPEEDKNVKKGRKTKESQEKSSQEAFLLKVKTEKLSVAENRAQADKEMSVEPSKPIKTEAKLLMPPPPIPRPRRNAANAYSSETQQFRRSTRGRKKNLEAEVKRESRATRRSARSCNEDMPPPEADSKPKRNVRGRKGQRRQESVEEIDQKPVIDPEKNDISTKEPDKLEIEVMPRPSMHPPTSRPKRTKRLKRQENVDRDSTENVEPSASQSQETADPQEKSRSIRTRKGEKATTEEAVKPQTEDLKSTSTEISSPILQSQPVKRLKTTPSTEEQREDNVTRKNSSSGKNDTPFKGFLNQPVLNETMVLHINTLTPPVENNCKPMMNETVVLNKATSTPNINKKIMNETVTLNMNGNSTIMTNDKSMMTDTDTQASVQRNISSLSLVKQQVQQLEELAAGRATRLKTRALNKQLEQIKKSPSAHLLSASTLARLADVQQNVLLKPNPDQSNSSTKSRANIITTVKSFQPNSASKALNQINATQRTGEEKKAQRKKEAAARKREAMQARIEEQKRKREEKSAVREASDRKRERTLAQNARSRKERAAINQDMKEQKKQKELERKKQLQEKKVAKLEEEQRKAEAARKKQMERERIRKEALTEAKEMQATTQQYLAKQKEREKIKLQQMEHRMEADRMHTSMTAPGTPAAKMAPVHMADGFEYMNSDSEDDDKQLKRPTPAWSTGAERNHVGLIQGHVNVLHVDRLFSVQKHSPDLNELFPLIDKRDLIRTSSAVWLTPPRLLG